MNNDLNDAYIIENKMFLHNRKQNVFVDNTYGSRYNLTEITNSVISLRSVRSGFYRRTK